MTENWLLTLPLQRNNIVVFSIYGYINIISDIKQKGCSRKYKVEEMDPQLWPGNREE